MSRPAWQPAFASLPADLALQDAFGRYCSACERRLPQGGVAWDAATSEAVAGPADLESWPELFVLCGVCAAAAARPQGPASGVLALPDRDLTFTLAEPPPFRYELRTLVLRSADPAAEATNVERVIVRPATAPAAETVRRFALNTPFHRDDELVAPPGAPSRSVEALDWRLIDRTRAWRAAERAADRLRRSPSTPDRTLLGGTVAAIIEERGCWSVWATVLWDRLRDAELLARLLLPPRGEEGAPVTAAAHAFPATREDWLPPTSAAPEGRPHG